MTISQKIWKKLADSLAVHRSRLLPSSKMKVACPFCGWQGTHFLPNGVELRKNARCPNCDSLERHRLYYLYLKTCIPVQRQIRVLHFAPEKILMTLFRSFPNVDYLSADIVPGKAMVVADITNTPFMDDAFDLIFCSHVLEHVPDDRKAMRELRRIMNPTGFGILQVPIKTHRGGIPMSETYEDFSITDPGEREKAFGQHDHVRIYGTDFRDRLEAAKFNVKLIKFAEQLSEADRQRYCLLPDHPSASETEGWIFQCSKSLSD
jgi:SAM-dependent methyltransferase